MAVTLLSKSICNCQVACRRNLKDTGIRDDENRCLLEHPVVCRSAFPSLLLRNFRKGMEAAYSELGIAKEMESIPHQ